MRLLRSSALVFVASCALLAGAAPPALAQSDADRATARSLGMDGEQALDSKDYKTAEDRFRRADNLVHAPTLMLGLARALAGLGRYVEAQEAYNRIVREGVAPGAPEAFKRALADAKREVDGMAPKIGGVTISVHGTGGADVPTAKVTLDGAPVSTASLGVRRSIDPGSHVLQVTADGYKPAEAHFEVTAGGSVDQPVTLEVDTSAQAAGAAAGAGAQGAAGGPSAGLPANPVPETPSGGGARAVLPWVAFGVGGVGLAAGAVTGIIAMGKHSDLANSKLCNGTTCDPSQQSSIDSYHSMATVSTVAFVVGGVGVAAGAVLLLTRPKAEATVDTQSPAGQPAPSPPPPTALRVTPVIGFGTIGAVGEF